MNDFCVYEHWRPDTAQCFYVGKGKLKRAFLLRRRDNLHHRRIVDKLARGGLKVKVRIIANYLSEDGAFAIEIDRIAFWAALGVRLANNTSGGEGASGCVRSDEFKAKVSGGTMGKPKPWLRGRKHSNEHRAAISAGLKGRECLPETRSKISAAQKGKPRPELIGRKLSEAGLERLRNRVFTDEHRCRISEAKRGKPKSPEHRAAISAALRGRKRPVEITSHA